MPPAAFDTAAWSFGDVAAAARPTASNLLPLLTGAATAALILGELRPILRAVVWLAGAA